MVTKAFGACPCVLAWCSQAHRGIVLVMMLTRASVYVRSGLHTVPKTTYGLQCEDQTLVLQQGVSRQCTSSMGPSTTNLKTAASRTLLMQ